MSKQPTISELKQAVNLMDCLSQGAFDEIESLVKVALAYMETADGYRHPENIAQVLRAIWGIVETGQDTVGGTADEVGCGYSDPGKDRRYEAWNAARAQADADVRKRGTPS